MPKKTPRVIVSVTNDLYTDQRVHKVCTFLEQQGYEVLLVGRLRKSSVPLPERSYQTKRLKLKFETGAKFYAFFNLRLFFFLLFKRADILLANDLDTLLANYAAKAFKPNARLVYDSHEYFTEVPELLNRPRVQNIWIGIEKWIFPKLRDVYTVNESIAEIYRKVYRKDVKVVRNISPKWSAKHIKSKRELGIPEDRPMIIIQGAGINMHRGAEEAVAAMKSISAVLFIVGNGDVVPQLKQYVTEHHLSDRVRFVDRLPYDDMMNYTYHADIGLTLDRPTSLNYVYSLPNKVFDYMHTSTAIVATNIKEVARVVQTHEIGEIIEELSVDSLTNTIQSLLNNPAQLEQFKENCKHAALTEHWEKETEVLQEIYPKVGQ